MADWVLAVERAYVAAATKPHQPRASDPALLPRARAAIGALASRYLAVGTPRTLGLIADPTTIEAAALSVTAHATWFAPRELRCAGAAALATSVGGKPASIAEALASDIVCVHTNVTVTASQLRRGTHLNMLSPSATIDAELRALAAITEEAGGLPALAAGLVDGRQLDELTVFFAGDAAIAIAALAALA